MKVTKVRDTHGAANVETCAVWSSQTAEYLSVSKRRLELVVDGPVLLL